MSPLLTVEELMELLKLSRTKVYDLKEKIGYLKIDGSIRFREEDVVSYLNGQKVNGREWKPAPTPRLKHLRV